MEWCFSRWSRTINWGSTNPFRSCWMRRAPSGRPSAMPSALSSCQHTTEIPANVNPDPKSLPCRRRQRKKCRRQDCEMLCRDLCGVNGQCPIVTGPALLKLPQPCTNSAFPEVFTEATTWAHGNCFPSLVNHVQVSTLFKVLPLIVVKPDFLWKAALIGNKWDGKQK